MKENRRFTCGWCITSFRSICPTNTRYLCVILQPQGVLRIRSNVQALSQINHKRCLKWKALRIHPHLKDQRIASIKVWWLPLLTTDTFHTCNYRLEVFRSKERINQSLTVELKRLSKPLKYNRRYFITSVRKSYLVKLIRKEAPGSCSWILGNVLLCSVSKG